MKYFNKWDWVVWSLDMVIALLNLMMVVFFNGDASNAFWAGAGLALGLAFPLCSTMSGMFMEHMKEWHDV